MTKRLPALVAAISALALSLTVAASARATTPDVRLLADYEPMMQFDRLEQFLPTKVESFLTDASLEELTAPSTWTVAEQNAAPGDLPGPGSGTWRLNENACTPDAPIGGLACYAADANQGGGGPTVYGRVVRQDGQIVLQYWYFYYDDVYSYSYPPNDFIWQAHEGDWENVDVVLTDDEQPLSVGLSQHCAGETRAWGDTNRFDGTHPVVYVALGSHANYFTTGTHPIDTACIPGPALALLSALHLPLPVDYTFAGGAAAGPPGSGSEAMPVEQIGADDPAWVGFPGAWGEAQYLHAPRVGTVAFGTSPVGPAYHAEWTDPLGRLATWTNKS